MNMLYVLIPLAMMLIAAAAWALIWAIRSGQFDDLDTQGWSVVLDEDHELGENPQPKAGQCDGPRVEPGDGSGDNSAEVPARLKHDGP